jgi:hypothetical protein
VERGDFVYSDPPSPPQSFQIFQSNIDGSNQRLLLSSETFYQQFPEYNVMYMQDMYEAIELSFDQSRLFFNVAHWDGLYVGSYCSFFSLDINTGDIANLFYGCGHISSDGERAIVMGRIGHPRDTFLVQRDSQQRITLNECLYSSADWLPDGRFVYSQCLPTDDGIIAPMVLANPDGSTIQVLVESGGHTFHFSPDQQQVAFLVGSIDQSRELWLVNLDGSGLRQVMTLPEDTTDMVWR